MRRRRISPWNVAAREDAYYYGRKRTVELPVYRAILDDVEETRLYLAPGSGVCARAARDGIGFHEMLPRGGGILLHYAPHGRLPNLL